MMFEKGVRVERPQWAHTRKVQIDDAVTNGSEENHGLCWSLEEGVKI